MKRILFFVLALNLVFPAFAADDNIVTALESRYQKITSWQADFEQTSHIEVLGQTLAKTGRLEVVRPDLLRIEYETEPRKIYLFQKKSLHVYQPDTNSAQKFADPKTLISREALSFLSGLAEISQLFVVATGLKEPKEFLQIQDAKLTRITLIPKDENSAILRLTLGVDAKTMTLKEAVLFNASGNVSHYAFKNIEFDKDIAKTRFELPTGVKVSKAKGI